MQGFCAAPARFRLELCSNDDWNLRGMDATPVSSVIGSDRTFRYDARRFGENRPHVPRPYFWAYHIVITNIGKERVQLRTRHWIITDAAGRKQEVRGEGVVGEQPVLAPGERFEYTSGVPLPTASGFMTGRYQIVSESGERFEIGVPTF